MTHTLDPVKVALVDLDGQTVPVWVPQTLDREGITLMIRQCNSRVDCRPGEYDAGERSRGALNVVVVCDAIRLLVSNRLLRPMEWFLIRLGLHRVS